MVKRKSKFELKKDRKIYADNILHNLSELDGDARKLEAVGLNKMSDDIYARVAHTRAMMMNLYKQGIF